MRRPLEPFWGAGHGVNGSFDLSSRLDLTSAAFSLPLDGHVYLSGHSWIPAESIERREKSNRDRFHKWADEGWLTIQPGASIDYKRIIKDVKSIAEGLKIIEFACDPWGLEYFAQRLEEEEYEVIEFRQGMRTMSPATKIFESLVYSKVLVHDGNPVIRWALGNCKIESDAAGNQKPSKKRSTGKIDPLVSSIMAACRANMRLEAADDGSSVYDNQGLTLL